MMCAKLKKEAGMYGIYYASLALADFLLMGPCLIPQIWAQCEGHKIEISDRWTQIWGFTYITARMSSILNLSVISLERMVAVLAPHFYRTRIDKSYAVIIIAACWLLSLLVATSPYLVNEDYEYFVGAAQASTSRELAVNNTTWQVTTDILSLYLPSFIIIVSVCVISWRVRRMRRKDNRVTVTLLTVLCAYIACFTVYFVWVLLRLLHLLDELPKTKQLYLQNFAFLILGVHSAVNPIIYAFKASQFKVELRHINDQCLLKCLSFIMKVRQNSHVTSLGTMHTQAMNKSTLHSQRLNNNVEMKDLNHATPIVDC